MAVKTPVDADLHGTQRLINEAGLLASFTGSGARCMPRLVQDGTRETPPFLVEELIEGASLRDFARELWSSAPHFREPRTIAARAGAGRLGDVLEVVHQLATTLASLHRVGVVHGDLSPDNVLLRPDRQPVMVDFGSVTYVSRDAPSKERLVGSPPMQGTAGYAAPELIRGSAIDQRADLYSLGCIAYELVAGQPPFSADNSEALLQQHLSCPPPPLSEWVSDVPVEVELTILGLLQKDPHVRSSFASDVARRLASFRVGAQEVGEKEASDHPYLYRSRLVGRDRVYARLTNQLREASANRGGCVLLVGESGLGKTRLLNDFVRHAMASGFEVVESHDERFAVPNSNPAMRHGPLSVFVPFLQLLASACADEQGAELRASLSAALSVLAPYEVGLERLGSGTASLPAISQESARDRIFHSLAESLCAIGQRRRLLLVADDLQWADDLSLAFLATGQASVLRQTSVLIVAAIRDDDLSPAVQAVIDAHSGQCQILERLNQHEIRVMLRDICAAQHVSDRACEMIYRQSEGSPFFVAELVRTALSDGVLIRYQRPDLEWGLDVVRDAASLLPATLREVLERRFADLRASTVAVLDLISVIGRDVDMTLLQHIASDSTDGALAPLEREDVLLSALEDLRSKGILVHLGSHRYRFAHDKLRECRAHAVSADRRRQMHRHAAEHLAAMPGVDSARLAGHWCEAGEALRALPHIRQAALQADKMHDSTQALLLYSLYAQQAAFAHQADPALREVRIEALEALADGLLNGARHADARLRLSEALALTTADESRTRARLFRKTAQSRWTLHEYEQASVAIGAAREALGPAPALFEHAADIEEWIEIQHCQFWFLYFARQLGPATRALIDELRPVVQSAGTPRQLVMFLQCEASDQLGRSRYFDTDIAISSARQALAVLSRHPELSIREAEAHFDLGFALLQSDIERCREALHCFQTARDHAERHGDLTNLARIIAYTCVAHRRLDNETELMATLTDLEVVAERASLPSYLGIVAACRAWLHWKHGGLIGAQAAVERALDYWRQGAHRFPFQWLALFVWLDLLIVQDVFEGLVDVVHALLDTAQRRLPCSIETELESAIAAAALGDEVRALVVGARACAEARRHAYL